MILKNDCLIRNLNKVIHEMNEDSLEDRIELIKEEKPEISREDLLKIKKLPIELNLAEFSTDKLQEMMQELSKLLEEMHLDGFYFMVENGMTEQSSVKMDTAFIHSLNNDIKQIFIQGVDFSKEKPELFSKFHQISVLGLCHANIANMEIFSQLESNVGIDVSGNPVENDINEEMVAEIEKHNGRFSFSSLESLYNKLAFAIVSNSKELDLSNLDIPDNQIDDIVKILNRLENFQLTASKDIIDRLNSGKTKFNPISKIKKLIIASTGQLDTESLMSHPDIEVIQIIDSENRERKWDNQEEPYTREEYLEIRKKIDEIVKQVEVPEENEKDREKKIFAQLYRLLGEKIEYNYYAITEEGKKDEKLQITCRNLYDALVKGKTVCAGYSDTVKNVSSEFGIKVKNIIRGRKDRAEFARYWGYDENDFQIIDYEEDGPGHAWNLPQLDGENYLCDLTYDEAAIKAGSYPLNNFCISEEDFDIQHAEYKLKDEGEISELSDEKQLKLFGFSKQEIEKRLARFSIEDFIASLEQIKSQEKLTNCAISVASEIKASDFEGIEQCFTREENLSYDEKYQ